MKFALLTISDSCYRNSALDKSGPALKECLQEAFPDAQFMPGILPDDVEKIKYSLTFHASRFDVILTTGGTGFSSRDVTPEATKAVIQRHCPGIVFALLNKGFEKTPMAALSRLEAGILDKCLIINLPGSPKACRESVPVLIPILPHAVSLLQDDKREIEQTHVEMQT